MKAHRQQPVSRLHALSLSQGKSAKIARIKPRTISPTEFE
jgi:hypothetical protein